MIQPITKKEEELLDIVFIAIVAKYHTEFMANDFYTDKEKEGWKPYMFAAEEFQEEVKKCMYRNFEKIINKITT